ncbi:MAG TPA: calcium-translocating P-type ATPase, SERCA-type [Bacillota bacterium]|nr:calcium-translocating P-type ATPase, SERCA-type [Bacillota bacterium]
MKNWFNQSAVEAIAALQSRETSGLSSAEAAGRLTQYGVNLLHAKEKISPWRLFFAQFLDFMVLVLLGAAVVSGFLGEKADAVTIIAIVILNAILGFIQEYRAEKSLEALKELTAPQARVLRDKEVRIIAAQHLVPGDILLLESGDRIAADGRIIQAVNLEVNEATLTGESHAVLKTETSLTAANPVLGDQKNMVFAGTAVVNGRAKVVVTATGMKTEIGKIAGMINTAENDTTPLQQRLEQLGRLLVVLCLGICAAVGTLGILRGEPPRQMFLSAVSLAVAAIPEGLPAIVTIALAIGVQKMIRRKAIIRKLPAVETLGCATVICSDKTGTLTQNRLSVTRLGTAWGEYHPDQFRPGQPVPEDLNTLMEIAVLCNNATLDARHPGSILGDPTEQALLNIAATYDLKNPGKTGLQRLGENPFSSERKRMSVWVGDGRQIRLMVKGAPDIIMERCTKILTKNGIVPFDNRWKTEFKNKVEVWGTDALRVLAFAYREGRSDEPGGRNTDAETGLVLVGLTGMTDPPRPESKLAVEKSRRAGIRTKMITGDYPRTAAAIAKQIGLLRPEGKIITGAELDQLSDQQLFQVIQDIDVFARVSPHHKLRVVKALKRKGEIVAMTGDGVNDAPAVKEADIGVAMGLGGTDVTKEASAMVISDDNYATIVAAVEEGRVIYDNIRKFIRYLLSCNIGEILTMFGGLMLGVPVPLLPIQILWVNLVTDGLPAIALGMEPAGPGIMNRPPRPSKEGIFARGLGLKIILQGVMIGVATLTIFLIKMQQGTLLEARTAAFTALVFAQLCFAFRCRSESIRLSRGKLQPNPYLVGAVLISSAMQFLAIHLPWLQRVFYTTALKINDWGLIMATVLVATYVPDVALELRKILTPHFTIFRVNTHRPGNLVGK